MPLDIEFAQNGEPRCPVVLLLDTSGSMSGMPIDQLNAGLVTFKQAVQQDRKASLRVEVTIITFDSSVNTVQDFITVDQFYPPKLKASGSTSMGNGIESALNQLESRRETYNSYGIPCYKPRIILITDGGPTDGESWKTAAQRVRQEYDLGNFLFYAVGVQGADMNTLRQIAPLELPPVMLQGLNFKEFFKWLSDSMVIVSESQIGQQISLPPTDKWAQTTA
ncbi:VWA domain-containing protein [Microcoleus sp. A006_D1]|uniref:vWA domain-containing protein n=1 Tax=Microcoleus sp. A006_D1 TaxID=3055267 RepID=UPI002FCE7B72